jgi:DHA3 family tetracycline resistance protein-like MFS transporter
MRTLASPLRTRSFRLLVAGSTVSLVGDGIYSVAMAVAALRTAHPASTLAMVAIAGLAPRIVFGLLGGVLADRVSRRAMLVCADLVRLAVVTVLGLALLDGAAPAWLLVACVVPLGAASGAAAPAFGAILPDLVEEADLVSANSVMGAAAPFASMMLGPVLGGVLASVDVGLAMLADAGTFAVSALCVLLLRPIRHHDKLERDQRPPPWADFREGLAYVRRTPWLLVNLLCGVLISFAVAGAFTMLPLLVTRGYGAPSQSFGYLLAVGGVAATVTAIVIGMLRPRRRPLASSYLMYVVGLAAVAGLGLAPNIWVAALFVALMFTGATAGNIWQDTILGSRIPRQLRGRVSSLDWLAGTVSAPLSIVVAAALVGQFGIRSMFVGAGAVAGLGSALGLLLLLRSGEPPEPVSADDVTLAA